MIFIELIGTLIIGGVSAWVAYEIVLYGLFYINDEIDLLSPAIISTLVFGFILAWRFDFSLAVFLTHASDDVAAPSSAILLIVAKLKYVFLIMGFILGTKLKLRFIG